MADGTDGFIGNNSDNIGQGLAYVLPQSRTEAYAVQLLQEQAAQRRAKIQALSDARQQENDQYAKDLYAQVIPAHDAKSDAYINGLHKDYLDAAAKFNSTTGKDAFRQPQFVEQRNEILSKAKQSNDANKTYAALKLAKQNDKDNRFSTESVKATDDWISAYDKDPVSMYGKPAPELNIRPYGINDLQKLMKPHTLKNGDGTWKTEVANRHDAVVQAQGLLPDPKWDKYLQEQGANTHVGDVFHLPNGKGGIYYPTDSESLGRIADHLLAKPDSPGSAATFQAAGIDPKDPYAKERLMDLAAKNNTAYGNTVSKLADYAGTLTNKSKERSYQGANYDLAQQRANKTKGSGGNTDATFTQQAITGILNGDDDSKKSILPYLPEGSTIANEVYSRDTDVSKKGDRSLHIVIPNHTIQVDAGKGDGTMKPKIITGINKQINLNTKDGFNEVNAVISQYSKLKTSAGKLNIEGGKPRGQIVQPVAPATHISSTTPTKTKIKGSNQRLF